MCVAQTYQQICSQACMSSSDAYIPPLISSRDYFYCTCNGVRHLMCFFSAEWRKIGVVFYLFGACTSTSHYIALMEVPLFCLQTFSLAYFQGLKNPNLPKNVVFHGINQAQCVHLRQYRGNQKGKGRQWQVCLSDGIHHNRICH